MFQNILNNTIIKGSKILGVDYFIGSDGNIDLNCIILNQKKGKISIEKKFAGINSIEQLNDSELKGLPVALSVDGKGVMFKIVEHNKNQKLIHHILPNAKEEDFYIQSAKALGNKIVVSAIRREVLNPVLEKLKETGIQLISLHIGPLAIKNLVELLNKNTFCTNRYDFVCESASISTITKTSEAKRESIQFGDDEIYSDDILVYATALSFYIDDSEDTENELIAESAKEYIFKRLFTMAGWFALAFFFTLLMINYFYYNNYNQKLNTLTFSYNQNRELIKKLDTLKSEYLIKEQYFVNSGFLDASKLSYYADRIANSLPSEIKLTEMNINPLSTKIKDEKAIGFSHNLINISGNVSQSIVLNNWAKKLKSLDWIENVNIVEYNQEVANIPAEFKLEIDLK